jgi:hypothetical protein
VLQVVFSSHDSFALSFIRPVDSSRELDTDKMYGYCERARSQAVVITEDRIAPILADPHCLVTDTLRQWRKSLARSPDLD